MEKILAKIPEKAIEKLPVENLVQLAIKKGYDFEGYDEATLAFFDKKDIVAILNEQYEEQIRLLKIQSDSSSSTKETKGYAKSNFKPNDEKKKTQAQTRRERNKKKKQEELEKTLSETEEETLERLKKEERHGMKFVEPIRDPEKIKEIKEYLKEKNMRDYMIFLIGINTALRVSDLILLRAFDFTNYDYKKIDIIERKTGKVKSLYLNPTVAEEIRRYIENNQLADTDFLFPSRKKKEGKKVPITRIQVHNIVKDFIKAVGLEDKGSYGCHSLRKTWAYMYYVFRDRDIAYLMDKLNHSSQQVTLRYIGMTEQWEQENAGKFSL